MQASHEMKVTGRTTLARYSSTWATVKSIFQSEGTLGFFQGLTSTWLREVPGYFFFFGGYEVSRSFFTQTGQCKEDLGSLPLTVSGGMAGACFWLAVYPIDSVKSRIQVLSMAKRQDGFLLSFLHILRTEDSCVYHPGVPIFHDALKGWSCCKKRTTDFSEFLAIRGCMKGCHSNEKPTEPYLQDQTSDKVKAEPSTKLVIQSPKSAEKMQCERPRSDEPRHPLPIKVSRSLEQSLEKLKLAPKDQCPEGGSLYKEAIPEIRPGTPCKNSGCKAIFKGAESEQEACTFHPGVPVFHEGMKYWSCCGIKTTEFSAFLEQEGCSTGNHRWLKEEMKLVSCRQDWHQTSSQVVVTVYAKNPLPALSCVMANCTVIDVHIAFEGDKVFKAKLELWGIVDVQKSFVNMVPTKVEISLRKASPMTWAKLEYPQSSSQPEHEQTKKEPTAAEDFEGGRWEESDDSLSWSEEGDEEREEEAVSK
ncbi:integrin beta-1-binding protein 2 isoform X2 [Carettochelys insculpta]